jgi:ADP-ribosylglycohydrolase
LLQNLYRGENDFECYRLQYGELAKSAAFKRFQSTQGHICNAIKNVMDTFFKFPEYTDVMEPMRDIIEKGYDTDSNAALLGALLGAKQDISGKYLKKIRKVERITKYF